MSNYLACFTLTLLAFGANATEPYVDLRDVNIVGKVTEITAPNLLKIATRQRGKPQHFWVDLIQVDFGHHRDRSCNDGTLLFGLKKLRYAFDKQHAVAGSSLAEACWSMAALLDGEQVQVEVTQWDQPVVKGFVFMDTTNVNYDLIEKGWYPVDYKQTRDASLALLERHARCQRVGIWRAKMGIPEEDMKCQD